MTDKDKKDKQYPAYYYGPTYEDGQKYTDSEDGSCYEMRKWPSQSVYSFASGTRSLYSTYTPTASSYFLPIVSEQPDILKKPNDNRGMAVLCIFCNPIFGLIAWYFSELSITSYTKLQYKKAALYGDWAKGLAVAGFICTCIVLLFVIAQVLHHHFQFVMS